MTDEIKTTATDSSSSVQPSEIVTVWMRIRIIEAYLDKMNPDWRNL